jgi:apolipoprotein N-acyltransferase
VKGRTAPAALSGALLTLAAPPSPLPLLALAALAPWAASIAGLGPGRAGRLAAARSGALLFAVHGGTLLLWVLRLAFRVGPWPLAAYLAQVALLALLGAGVGVLLHGTRGRVPLPVGLALAWTAGEWVRGSALGPLDFPWMGIAVPLTAHVELVQGAAWLGERGVAFGVAAVNGALALALVRSGGSPARSRSTLVWIVRPAVVAAMAVLTAWGSGALRLARLRPGNALQTVAVQPAVPLALKRGDPLAVAASVAAADGVVPDTVLVGVDLVVLPETAVPVTLDGAGAGALRRTVSSWARRTGAPVAVGAYGAAPGGGRTNAVFLAGPDPERPWPRADKARLVPGVEWSPFGEGSLRAGTEPALLRLPGGPVLAVLVCIESAGPEPARTLRALGAEVLLNVTNDAWLGEAPGWTRTAAFRQHPAHLRLRAVETGAGALRVGNNGLTTVVDPGGRERVLLAPHRTGFAPAGVATLAAPPFFVATGDLVGPAATAFALLVGIAGRRRGNAREPGGVVGRGGADLAGGEDATRG